MSSETSINLIGCCPHRVRVHLIDPSQPTRRNFARPRAGLVSYRRLEVIHIRQHRHISFQKCLLHVRDTVTVAGPIFSISHGVPRRSTAFRER
ncbi:Protein of unknown function [Pyronema omphalodes CBS 100304]|uniref:Uncharacterized protein n=1 Tax=Pyronema omphalodes (strain CBS 100304) TaxID=1076935 RepID=U4L4G8_PYROM|nr:Protein of unknown function [Pyronema omphalodes CBS 100304]